MMRHMIPLHASLHGCRILIVESDGGSTPWYTKRLKPVTLRIPIELCSPTYRKGWEIALGLGVDPMPMPIRLRLWIRAGTKSGDVMLFENYGHWKVCEQDRTQGDLTFEGWRRSLET